MDKVSLILDNGEQFWISSYEKLTKNKYKLFGRFDNGETGYVIVSFPIWTIQRKRCSLEQLLETHYIVLEIYKEDA